MALTISGLVLGPVGGWMILALNEQAPTAGRFNDAAESRLLNTYLTRDIASAEHVTDGTNGTPHDCTGGSTTIDSVVLNVIFLATEEEYVVYAVGRGGDGSESLYRRTCTLAPERPLTGEIEIIRGVDPDSVLVSSSGGGRTVTLDAVLDSGAEMSVTATRRASLGALSGANGTVTPIARIVQLSRTERSGGDPLKVTLSAAQSWDFDTPTNQLSYSWTAEGVAGGTPATGNTDTQEFSFDGAGDHLVTLTVADTDGNTSTATFNVPLVNQAPVIESASILAANGTTSGAIEETFTFTAVATDPDDSGSLSYTWRIPGGPTLTGATSTYAFPVGSASGLYDVVLEVSDEESVTSRIITIGLTGGVPVGGIEFDPERVNVVDGPGRINDHTTAEAGFEVTFSPESPSMDVVSWELLDADGVPVEPPSTSRDYTYPFPANTSGLFTIRLTPQGGADPIEEDFRINRAPVAAFDAPVGSGPLPLTVQFQNTSSDDHQPEAMSWQWNFNFGFPGAPWTSNLQNPQFTYTNPGSYAVVLTVTDADSVPITTSRQITIPGAPATPGAPEWVDGDVTFDPVPGASRYRVVTTHTGFEPDGSPCLRSGVNATVAATGPFEVNGGTNTCPVGPKSTSATLAVEANGIWSAPSLPAVRSVP